MDEEIIFLRAVEFDSREQRDAYLDDACGENLRLRESVESLLEHHALAEQFLEFPSIELQQTHGSSQRETVSDEFQDRTLEMLALSEKSDCIGQLGPYEILDVIGRGGMGVVLRARDSKLNRIVAIKLMNEAFSRSDLGTERFLREAQAAAAVKHDNVVTIHAIHDDSPLPYLVMEYVEGQTLDDLLEPGEPLPVGEIVRIGSQIAHGLAAAHARGLIHRDIKPANILLEAKSRRAKITDFGLARLADGGRLTQLGNLAGTPQYMSPEQAQGQPADARSDLFSFGSVLYTMCTGRPAFSADSALAILRGICDDWPRPIREINQCIPGWLEIVVDRLLEKDPANRPRSADEVASWLTDSSKQDSVAVRHSTASIHAGSITRWLAPIVSGALLVAFASVIIVVNHNGKSTRIEVPDGSTVRFKESGQVNVELPSDRETIATPPATIVPVLRDVAAQLVNLNPGFDGDLQPTVVADQVVGLRMLAHHVKDLTPLKQLTHLKSLECTGTAQLNGILTDLSPLRTLPLEVLDCSHTRVSDLEALEQMPLTRLSVAHTQVNHLRPLHRLPLAYLNIQDTKVGDLSPLAGLPLVELNVSSTRITDLSPLEGMKLVAFYCDSTKIADFSPLRAMPLKNLNWRGYDPADLPKRQIVKSVETLEWIDSLPAAEYWRLHEGSLNQ